MIYSPDSELRCLVDRLHDGPPLRKPEMGRLEELLEDDAALAYYLDVAQQEALMPESLQRMPASVKTGKMGFTRRISWLSISVAAAICLAFLLGFSLGHRKTDPASVADVAPLPALPARITGLVGVEWAESSSSQGIAAGATPGRIAVDSGLVELTYSNGVRLTIEGPADYLITDATSGRLVAGKLFANVPPGAEGFRIDYFNGAVVDLGTEFGIEAHPNGSVELGVFDGEVELHLPGQKPLSLLENQSLIHDQDAENPIRAVALNRDKFVRKMPSRDFRWELDSTEPLEISFDVTHLVWKPANYRAIFKWVEGYDALVVDDVRLCRDGKVVAADSHEGCTGVLRYVSDNVYALDLKQADFSPGRWTVVARLKLRERTGKVDASTKPLGGQGVLQFEEGLVTSAGPTDFIGRWAYSYLGSRYVREFHSDGSVTLERDGMPLTSSMVRSRWSVDRGTLQVTIPRYGLVESHFLRDPQTLIMSSNPYENASKLDEK